MVTPDVFHRNRATRSTGTVSSQIEKWVSNLLVDEDFDFKRRPRLSDKARIIINAIRTHNKIPRYRRRRLFLKQAICHSREDIPNDWFSTFSPFYDDDPQSHCVHRIVVPFLLGYNDHRPSMFEQNIDKMSRFLANGTIIVWMRHIFLLQTGRRNANREAEDTFLVSMGFDRLTEIEGMLCVIGPSNSLDCGRIRMRITREPALPFMINKQWEDSASMKTECIYRAKRWCNQQHEIEQHRLILRSFSIGRIS